MRNQEYNYRMNIDLIYPSLMPNDGISDKTILSDEQKFGFRIPRSLRSFYRLVGNRKDITESYNRLLNIDAIFIKDDILVFFEESQAVLFWGIRLNDLPLDDPIVFVAENSSRRIWKTTGDTVSVFLISMLYWQAVNGGLSYTGIASGISGNIRTKFGEWSRIALGSYFSNMEILATHGKVICIVDANDTVDLYAGSRSSDGFKMIEQLADIEWDYSTLRDD